MCTNWYETVNVMDQELQNRIKMELRIENRGLQLEDMEKLKKLRIYRVKSLRGLEFAENLLELEVDFSPIEDFTIILELKFLKVLRVNGNYLKSLVSLGQLINLHELEMKNSGLTDISALQNLTQLISLKLYNNNISDLTPLSSMENLTHLYIGSNRITNIDALANLKNLTDLDISDNQISDISSVENLSLLKFLSAYKNEIRKITPLSKIKSLRILDLSENAIEDISPLQDMLMLKNINLSSNPIRNLEVFRTLPEIRNLKLSKIGVKSPVRIARELIKIGKQERSQNKRIEMEIAKIKTQTSREISNNKSPDADLLKHAITQIVKRNPLAVPFISDVDQVLNENNFDAQPEAYVLRLTLQLGIVKMIKEGQITSAEAIEQLYGNYAIDQRIAYWALETWASGYDVTISPVVFSDTTRMSQNSCNDPKKLMQYVKNNDLKAIESLDFQEVNLNYKYQRGKTLLQVAIQNRLYNMAILLMERGSDPHLKGEKGRTPLIEAIRSEQSDLIQYMLDNPKDINILDDNENSALHYAAFLNDFKVVKQLISKGANPLLLNRWDITPLEIIIQNDQLNIFQEIYMDNPKKYNSLIFKNGDKILHNAVKKEAFEISEFLLQKGFDVDARSRSSYTPLIEAASIGSVQMIQLLLQWGADINMLGTKNYQTALMTAIFQKHIPSIETLIAAGSDVNKADADFVTPLMLASELRLPVIVNLLIENGAEKGRKDLEGKTAFDYAQAMNFNEIITLLM